MTTDRHLISLRLQNLSEDELQALYSKLVRITSGSDPTQGAGIDQTLHIFETTDSKRGELLSRLLGEESGMSERWRVGLAAGHLHLDRNIAYRSAPEQFSPKFFIGENEPVTSEIADNFLTESNDPGSEVITVERVFPNLPEGWTIVSRPPVSPKNPISTLTPDSMPSLWILVCRNPEAVGSILPPILESGSAGPPLLIVFDDPGDDVPEHVMDIRSCCIDDAPALLAQFFARAELLHRPNKRQLVRAITALYMSASEMVTRSRTESIRNESLKLALDKAEVAWELMFIKERQQAVMDLRINVVAHPFLKTRMIMASERDAQASFYLHRHLSPLIHNFIKCHALELAHVQLRAASKIGKTRSGGINTDSSHLRAGILMALPTLALLTPSFALGPSQIAEAIDRPMDEGGDQMTTADASEGIDLGDGLLGSLATLVASKCAPMIEGGKDWLGGLLKDQFSGVERQLGNIDERLGQLLGIVIASQVAVVIAAAIGTGLMIKGAYSLTQAEELLTRLLNDTEAEWPRIRQSLEALVPELEGQTSEILITRARRILTEIETL